MNSTTRFTTLGLAALVALTACGGWRDAFSAHPHVAATAAGQDLSVERLATWVMSVKRQQPPDPKNYSALAMVYVDNMVFAAQLARGRNMEDSLLVLRASWPTALQLRWNRFHDELFAAKSRLRDTQVDSAYQAGSVRLFQHILIQVPASATPQEVARKRTQTETLLRQISAQHGVNFAALAKRYSEDPGSKDRGGYLSTAGRGQYVAPFETAAWDLAPGAVSGVVRSPFGFHLIRRPPLSEVRDSFTADVERMAMTHLDSIYVNDVAAHHEIRIDDQAPALIRQVFENPAAARTDGRTLAKYRGGKFRVRDLVNWLYAIDPQEVRSLPGANDAQLKDFLMVVLERQLLIQQVDSAGVGLTPEDWTQVKAEYDTGLGRLEQAMDVSPALFRNSAATPDARVQLAAARVNHYLERALKGDTRFVPLSPFLAAILRDSEPWSVNAAGIAEAVERVTAQRAGGAAGATEPSRSGGIRKAPGPPPIPLDTSRHTYVR